jgi:DHA1 family inner membrane transport protein
VLAVLAARVARRTLLIGLMSVFAVANVMSALAPSYEWMLVFRFLSGLPHGAYFGIASLVAASAVPPDQRARAVARTMLGLTVATIVGVPLANWIGLMLGWRWGFGVVGVLALLTVVLVRRHVPRDRPPTNASPLRELGALKRRQVWLTLGIGAIGFGGLFAVYTYIASTLIEVTHVSAQLVPIVLCMFGLGMTAGTLIAGWLADRAVMPTVAGILLWSAGALALFPLAASNIFAVSVVVLMIGGGGGLGTVLQTRLMEVAGDAQTLAAALNHSAFNAANALGPFLGGLAIAAGWGWTSTGWVGCALALAGLVVWGISMLVGDQVTASASAPLDHGPMQEQRI